jgi:hypothetical protein
VLPSLLLERSTLHRCSTALRWDRHHSVWIGLPSKATIKTNLDKLVLHILSNTQAYSTLPERVRLSILIGRQHDCSISAPLAECRDGAYDVYRFSKGRFRYDFEDNIERRTGRDCGCDGAIVPCTALLDGRSTTA